MLNHYLVINKSINSRKKAFENWQEYFWNLNWKLRWKWLVNRQWRKSRQISKWKEARQSRQKIGIEITKEWIEHTFLVTKYVKKPKTSKIIVEIKFFTNN